MARKYDFNYGGARANYNQVAGVGQMVEQGLQRFGDMTQKIQDEETRLVTDAAFAEWRATGELPKDLDPKVNLGQFQGLINDSLTADMMDEKISKLQYENSEDFRSLQEQAQKDELELAKQQIEVARTRAGYEVERLGLQQREAERANRTESLLSAAGQDFANMDVRARQSAGNAITDQFLTDSLDNPDVARQVKEALGVDLALDLQDPVNSEVLDNALDYMAGTPAYMKIVSENRDFRRAMANETASQQAELFNDWNNRWLLQSGGNRDFIAGLADIARVGGSSLPGGSGRSRGGSGSGAGSFGGSTPFIDASQAAENSPANALLNAGVSKKSIKDLQGFNGEAAQNRAQLEINQNTRGDMSPDEVSDKVGTIIAEAEIAKKNKAAVASLEKSNTFPSEMKPIQNLFDPTEEEFSGSPLRSFDDMMENSEIGFGVNSNMNAVPWDGKEEFGNYLEGMLENFDIDEKNSLMGITLGKSGDYKLIQKFQSLYQNQFDGNADMFKHFVQTWAMDRENRVTDLKFFKNNVDRAMVSTQPATIDAYFTKYKEAVLKGLGGNKKQISGATAARDAYSGLMGDAASRLLQAKS